MIKMITGPATTLVTQHHMPSSCVFAQTVAAVSPRLANANVLKLRTPVFFQNDPRTIAASKTLVSVSSRLFNVAPCLITLAETGVRVNPSLIGVRPFLQIPTINPWQLNSPPLPDFALL